MSKVKHLGKVKTYYMVRMHLVCYSIFNQPFARVNDTPLCNLVPSNANQIFDILQPIYLDRGH